MSASTVIELLTESFETDGNGSRYTTSVAEFTDGEGDFFIRTDGSTIATTYEVLDPDGTFYFAVMDTDGEPPNADIVSILWEDINIDSYTSLTFKGLFAEDDAVGQHWDADARVYVEYQIDDGGFVKLLQFAAEGDTNTEPGLDSDFDGFNDGIALTNVFTEYSGSIVGTGTALDIKITIENLEAGDEDIAIDNIRLLGTLVLPLGDMPDITESAGSDDDSDSGDDNDSEPNSKASGGTSSTSTSEATSEDHLGVGDTLANSDDSLAPESDSEVMVEDAPEGASASHSPLGITLSDDVLTATSKADVIRTLGGDDTVRGLDGNDRLFGGDGNDRLLGGDGRDRLFGNADDDVLVGAGERDLLKGQQGRDILRGGAMSDRLNGGRGSDVLNGQKGDDILKGGTRRDVLKGGAGDDWLSGGLGRDLIKTGAGRDRIVVKANTGLDRVTDFRDGCDRLDLVGIRFSQINLIQRGDDVLLNVGGSNVMRLENVSVSAIDPTDFV